MLVPRWLSGLCLILAQNNCAPAVHLLIGTNTSVMICEHDHWCDSIWYSAYWNMLNNYEVIFVQGKAQNAVMAKALFSR